MVHFNFILSDGDAENLMDWVRDAQRSAHEKAFSVALKGDVKMVRVYKSLERYVGEVIKKMHNKHVTLKKRRR